VNGKSDNELMFELQSGGNLALDIIIERWEAPIKSFIYRFTQDVEWVEELSQETFVKVYMNANRYDLNRKFAPWIYTIASNLCRNLLRWKSRRPRIAQSLEETIDHPERDQSVLEDPNSQNPCETIVREEGCSQIRDSIAELPDHLRAAIILYYYQGMTYSEIAEVLNCSIRGVETRLYRARKTLKQKIRVIPI
jgi:RNA polymerase sigma-70 factor, ECF subfamily